VRGDTGEREHHVGVLAGRVDAPIADLAVIWARTDEGVRGFVVERGTRGFETPEIERKFSLRASATGAIFLEDVVVPASAMLPGSTVGLKAVRHMLNLESVITYEGTETIHQLTVGRALTGLNAF
jgi:hypothetical protein